MMVIDEFSEGLCLDYVKVIDTFKGEFCQLAIRPLLSEDKWNFNDLFLPAQFLSIFDLCCFFLRQKSSNDIAMMVTPHKMFRLWGHTPTYPRNSNPENRSVVSQTLKIGDLISSWWHHCDAIGWILAHPHNPHKNLLMSTNNGNPTVKLAKCPFKKA